MNRKSARLILLLVIIGGGYLYNNYIDQVPGSSASRNFSGNQIGDINLAISNQQSGVQVETNGKVIKILPDDNQGSRHQRFLVKLPSDHVILIAHNIDLAPRIEDLAAGNSISIHGVFEWNAKGGVVHWTHHDPQGKHIPGKLVYQGRIYQ
jgi:hypothetical protein